MTHSVFGSGTFGEEIVYDFAAMQRQKFRFDGSGVLNVFGGEYTIYASFIRGMESYDTIKSDYSGKFKVSTSGFGFPELIPFGVLGAAGITNFRSVDDFNINGGTLYISQGLGFGTPIYDWGFATTDYHPMSDIKFYSTVEDLTKPGPKRVKRSQLYRDIATGTLYTPWLHLATNPFLPWGIPNYTNALLFRSLMAATLVRKQADIYDGIHYQSYFSASTTQ